jgi:hypothetical protein
MEEEQENEITFPAGVYISVIPDEITSEKIREYQEKYLKGKDVNTELHCTLIYSKKPHVDDIEPEEYTAVGTFQEFNLFGEDKNTLVIEINSQDLRRRNAELVEKYGFISDFDEYKSHVTLSYNADGIDINSLPPMDFAFSFINETVEPLDENWNGTGDENDEDEEGTLAGKALKKMKNKEEKSDNSEDSDDEE